MKSPTEAWPVPSPAKVGKLLTATILLQLP